MSKVAMPSVAAEGGLARYLERIRRFPMLEPEQEVALARRWRDADDVAAAHQLVTSHLRLVAKIAMGYRGYGLPVGDLIAEGNLGMMQAVKRFDPERGFRLATYAMWWIRAAIQEYILHSWSLVKMGTTAAQKKLFFNLAKVKRRIAALEEGELAPETVATIAERLGVTVADVISMNRRLAGPDQSLNAPINGEDGSEWQEWLIDGTANHEAEIVERDEHDKRRALLDQAMTRLNERERHIFHERHLKDEPSTLAELSVVYGISRERVRQIEARAMEKVKAGIRMLAAQRFLPMGQGAPA